MSNIIWAMKHENDSLQDLVNYIKIYAADYLDTNDIELLIKVPESNEDIKINGHIRRNIFLIIKEILHNMVKHSKTEKAEITITSAPDFSIEISDFGIGFNCKSIQPKKGNGLGNMRFRIEKLNGKIECSSSEKGTTYNIQIPLENMRQ